MGLMALAVLASSLSQAPEDRLIFEGERGPGKGTHVVLLAGDEEYRSEEGLPQLAKILSHRHGFRCTVLFSLGKDGTIDPDRHDNQPGLEALKTADLCILLLRFREWPEDQMKHFADYYLAGKPFLALRTSTHAFDLKSGPYARYGWKSSDWPGGFGKQVLGENWVSHWGIHGQQATRAIAVKEHPMLKGVSDIFGTTDVYEAHPPADAEILMRGQVVAGMAAADPAASGRKKTAYGVEQDLNDPMMPIVWTRSVKNETGKTNRILTCTMGAATDLLNEGFRRLVVNGTYWLTGLPVPAKANVELVGEYHPSAFGFGGYKKGLKPKDLR